MLDNVYVYKIYLNRYLLCENSMLFWMERRMYDKAAKIPMNWDFLRRAEWIHKKTGFYGSLSFFQSTRNLTQMHKRRLEISRPVC